MDGFDHRLDALADEMRECFIAMDERFRTLEQRIDQFEARVNDQLAALNAELAGVKRSVAQIERRVTNLENQSVATNARLDGLHLDMRQRFRVLTDRVGAIENLLAA
jgi:septal ring factor EnvC (AmiA/AmiB activator)